MALLDGTSFASTVEGGAAVTAGMQAVGAGVPVGGVSSNTIVFVDMGGVVAVFEGTAIAFWHRVLLVCPRRHVHDQYSLGSLAVLMQRASKGQPKRTQMILHAQH